MYDSNTEGFIQRFVSRAELAVDDIWVSQESFRVSRARVIQPAGFLIFCRKKSHLEEGGYSRVLVFANPPWH
jgi:hypothetical protein